MPFYTRNSTCDKKWRGQVPRLVRLRATLLEVPAERGTLQRAFSLRPGHEAADDDHRFGRYRPLLDDLALGRRHVAHEVELGRRTGAPSATSSAPPRRLLCMTQSPLSIYWRFFNALAAHFVPAIGGCDGARSCPIMKNSSRVLRPRNWLRALDAVVSIRLWIWKFPEKPGAGRLWAAPDEFTRH